MLSFPQGVLLQRMVLFVIVLLLCSLFLMPFSWNRIQAAAADENGWSSHELYTQLKSGKRVWKDKAYVAPEQPTVYLTFDDGPSKLTGKVLDILREEDVKATFFVLGEQVKAHPEWVRQAAEEGHMIGNHTYNHVYKELYSNVETFWNQIQKTEQILKEEAGIRTRLVRAPGGTFGNFDAFYFYYLDQAGYEVHDWNMDSGDSKRVGVPASEIIQTVNKGPFGKQVILLMHDGTGHEQTVKALPTIIRTFKDKGYAFAMLTPEVQPVHFSLGKPSTPRSLSEPAYEQLLALAEQHEKLLALEEQPLNKAAINEPSASQGELLKGKEKQEQKVPLELELWSRTYILEPDQYQMLDGHIQVPLRLWAQALGGQVEWQEAKRTAVFRYGTIEAEYDFARHEQRVQEPGMQETYHLPQMELRNGTVWVPLRATLELLGGRITSYGEENGRMRVRIDLHRGIPFMGWVKN